MIPRYKELKYDGKIYTKRYEIDDLLIENNFGWLIDAEVENLRIEIISDTLVINAGVWYNGIFEYGVIRDIDWRNGNFENGVVYNGVFKRIMMDNGIIFNGVFLNGEIKFAEIRGGDFRNVNISKNCKRETAIKVEKPAVQPEKIQEEPQTQNESYIKRFKDF